MSDAPSDLPARDDLRRFIRDVADFPKPGIVFKDITPLLLDHAAFTQTVEWMAEPFRDRGVTRVLGMESRGFIFGARVAPALGVGFIPARKPGKLPWRRARIDYALEYGSDALEIHEDACGPGDRVLVVDDVLATGGTAQAAAALVRQRGATVAGFAFLMELGFLHGRDRLDGAPVDAVLQY
ncbi:MAG TPA: adenine phosphoribosyltransferase [Myxococcota bacterium]|jgi:adenine phosphoribosyltransferase|nr:adenine phosphoribosyltransferase [Myxococcota bacterium]